MKYGGLIKSRILKSNTCYKLMNTSLFINWSSSHHHQQTGNLRKQTLTEPLWGNFLWKKVVRMKTSISADFRGKKMNFTVKFRGSIPQQKPKFRGTARNSAVCFKTVVPNLLHIIIKEHFIIWSQSHHTYSWFLLLWHSVSEGYLTIYCALNWLFYLALLCLPLPFLILSVN